MFYVFLFASLIASTLGYNSYCYEPLYEGDGDQSIEKWWYDKTENTCKPFRFKGRNNNSNMFNTGQECMSACWQYIAPPPANVTNDIVAIRGCINGCFGYKGF